MYMYVFKAPLVDAPNMCRQLTEDCVWLWLTRKSPEKLLFISQ